MRPSDRDMLQLGPWRRGADNLALETSVPPTAFRQGRNVDVLDEGKVVRRAGRELAFTAYDPSDLFGYGRRGFFVSGGSLYAFAVESGSETPPVEIYAGVSGRLAHALIDPDIFVSDGTRTLRIAPDNTVTPWTVPTPLAPQAEVGAGGALDAGRYHFAYAYRTTNGEEGPLSETISVDVEAGARIALFAPAPDGLRAAVYMTKPNGTELLHLATFAGGMANISRQKLGRPAPTVGLDPMPPGEFAALWNGRLVTAKDRLVTWSAPLQYGFTELMYNYIELSEPVTMLAAVETAGGFFIGQGARTYFHAGADPNEGSLREVYPAGVVPGTLQMVPGARLPFDPPPSEPVPLWLATNGIFCVGLPDGQVAPLTENRYAAMRAEEGAAMFLSRDGVNRYVATLRDPSPNNFALSDAFTAEVRPARRGT